MKMKKYLQSEEKPDLRTYMKQYIKPDIKQDIKPDIKPDIKIDLKSFLKPDIKPDMKPVILKQKEKDELNKIYFDTKLGLSSVDNFYRKIKQDDKLKITKAKVKEFLKQ
jgi:hypothetical protein